jgi:hypothetical protein
MKIIRLLAATGDNTFIGISEEINELYVELMTPLIAIFSGAAFLLGLWLGLKFLLAGGDEQKLKKAKESVKFFVIGIVVIFMVLALLPVIVGALKSWAGY